ncbi:Fes1 domain-containing protein [Crocinitomix catalasitica]|uniref:hypothetical protein n=1 Tax=Crocinitomix catalasitica TaxID=184607 RepID=UPI0004850AC8|nr:hypothetical protein [Crocinitomix catalasitica]
MKNLILYLILIFSYVPDVNGQEYKYEFGIIGVTSPGQAKGCIDEIRQLLKVKTFYFHDALDEFEMHSQQDFDLIDLANNLESEGFILVGTIVKSNL